MSDIQYLKGVGPKRAGLLEKLDINFARDLLHYYPRAYQDRQLNTPVSDFKKIDFYIAKTKVIRTQFIPTKNITIFKAFLQELPTGEMIEASWFKRRTFSYDPFKKIKEDFVADEILWIIGRKDSKYALSTNKISVDEYYKDTDEVAPLIHINRFVPVYALTHGLNPKIFREIVYNAINSQVKLEKETIPEKLLKKRKFLGIETAVRNIHFPNTLLELSKARERAIYEEFLLLSTALTIKRKQNKETKKAYNYKIKKHLLTPFKEGLGFTLTSCQVKVINEIFKDMMHQKPMLRLLQGDVGSGKTVAALSAILLAVENKYQTAFLAPTEILAEQHFMTMKKFLNGLDVNFEILTSKTTAKKKKEIIEKLSKGEIDILVGTHAIIEPNIKFKNLKLAVIDEQHKFGVKQRAILKNKAKEIDLLTMTATPIPRTLALAFYGDLDVSTIKELPPGRKEIFTCEANQELALERAKEEVAKGRQVYMVYPIIEESDKLAVKPVKEEFEKLSKGELKDYKLEMLHGQMSGKDKQKVMQKFIDKEIDILLATPVIEVGIDVKNVTLMIIQNAERFGLASLHQLRGRIGRGEHQSECLLVPGEQAGKNNERIKIMCKTNDGFIIGEKDIELRGPGEILGTRQHGEIEFKTADLVKDKDMLAWAVEDRDFLLQQDPSLSHLENQNFKERLLELYNKHWHMIDLS
ncbi:MAG: ATP-dependent DNA helicase RecG [Elusimicrobiaceae bacterium]|nr:ATP-dependent DNA helicase RecG [Elusimicrobiaceae bacterium]